MFKPTYLYIKTHNVTKLKYFGKTTRDDPFNYCGSGKYWNNHLRIHGNDVSTEILGRYFDEDECKQAALDFSIKHNIVESRDWANLKLESGLDGGDTSLTEGYKNGLKKIKNHSKMCKWWNNGLHQTFSSNPPDNTYIRGRLKFNNVGAQLGANIQKEKIWVNNGTIELMVVPLNTPHGFIPGRLKSKAFAGGKGRHSAKGSHWWNDGASEIMSKTLPGQNYKKGRLPK